jgi:ADP-ribose pyrophosphatase YjhB (NUDIX family)
VYSDPDRDPRFHTVTTVFTAQASGRPRAASDAAEARVFTPAQWRKLPVAFDHGKILEDYMRSKK